MNKVEAVHLERKEYWRALIKRCDASGQLQQDWCKENNVCATSMSKWRRTIWREEEAEKEFAAAREEQAFIDITTELAQEKDSERKELTTTRKVKKASVTHAVQPHQDNGETPRMMTPDAVIGYRDYMIGVYEHTSSQVLQKVMEVLKYA